MDNSLGLMVEESLWKVSSKSRESQRDQRERKDRAPPRDTTLLINRIYDWKLEPPGRTRKKESSLVSNGPTSPSAQKERKDYIVTQLLIKRSINVLSFPMFLGFVFSWVSYGCLFRVSSVGFLGKDKTSYSLLVEPFLMDLSFLLSSIRELLIKRRSLPYYNLFLLFVEIMLCPLFLFLFRDLSFGIRKCFLFPREHYSVMSQCSAGLLLVFLHKETTSSGFFFLVNHHELRDNHQPPTNTKKERETLMME